MIDLWPLLFPLTFILIYALVGEKGRYVYKDRNPAQRMCLACGQTQHAYCNSLAPGAYSWWEPNGRIINPKCKCHKDTQ